MMAIDKLRTGVGAVLLLLLGACATHDTIVREPVVPDQLVRASDRITDEAIRSDRQVIEGLRLRLRKLNEQGGPWPMDNYYVCKAQAWIDFAEIEYTDNDRGHVTDHALEQARLLIEQMEANAKDISRDTPIIPESMVVRQDLWDFVAQRKATGGPQCTECDLARLEVQLVAAGHDHAELGWRHAASGVMASERLARAVKYGSESCPVPADGGAGLIMSSAAGVGQKDAPEVPAAPSADELRVPVVVHFAYDKSLLSGETTAILGHAVQIMKAFPQITVTLVGHTDIRGGSAYNKALSLRRAAAVRAYLISAGIGENRISDEGHGAGQSLNVDAPAIKAFALDRRVELHFDNLPNTVIKTERQQLDVQPDR